MGLGSIFWINIEDYRNILLKQQIKKWRVDPLYFKNRILYVFAMPISVILAFIVILNQVLYNRTIHIENSIDILINIANFEIENGHFLQTGDSFDVCLLMPLWALRCSMR